MMEFEKKKGNIFESLSIVKEDSDSRIRKTKNESLKSYPNSRSPFS